MALSIKDPIAEELVRELAAESGETISQALIHAVEEQLKRLRGRRTVAPSSDLFKKILAISARCSALPDLDERSANEILGYDESGTFVA